MGSKERREREKKELRGKILDAARELFVEHGFENVSMRMIADRIEYSPTAIYLHFRDKDALFTELCAIDFLSLAGVFRKIERIGDPVERLRRLGQAYAQFGHDNPQHYRLMFMTPHPPHDHLEGFDFHNPEESAYAFLVQTVSEAIGQELLRPELSDVEATAQMIWAAIHGVISLRIAKCNDHWINWAQEQRAVDMMLDMLVRGIVREPVAV